MEQLPSDAITPWLKLAAAIGGGTIGLFWFSLFVWTARDAAARTGDVFLRLGALLLVLVLNVLGLVIYLLLRPPETIAERRERELIDALLTRETMAAATQRRAAIRGTEQT